MSLLTLENISKSYFGKTILDRISFRLDRGERLALIGSNGAGKTTLMKILASVETPDPDEGRLTIAKGTVVGYLQQELRSSTIEEAPLSSPELEQAQRALHQLELQMAADPQDADLLARYSKALAHFESIGGWDFHHRMTAALVGLGLKPDALDHPLSTYSGGERMRVALARLMVQQPDLLLLDEPTNHLDLEACEWLEETLLHYKGSVLVISHDRSFLDRVATCTAELKDGGLVFRKGNYTQFKEIESQERERLYREAKKTAQALAHESDVMQTMLSHRKMVSYHSRQKRVEKLSAALKEIKDRTHQDQAPFQLKLLLGEDRGDPNRVLIQARDLTVHFPDSDRPLFEPASLLIKGPDKVVICGPNGCGKTNLIRALSAQNPWLEGQVSLSPTLTSVYLDQWVRFEDHGQTVLQEWQEKADDLTENQSREWLARFGFVETDLLQPVATLSGGEKVRLIFALLFRESPDVLFLDEPTNHLDIASREILEDAIQSYPGAVVAVSHDRYFIQRIAQKIWGFVGDQLKEFDSFKAYRKALSLQNTENKALTNSLTQNSNLSGLEKDDSAKTPSADTLPCDIETPKESLWTESDLTFYPELGKIKYRSSNLSQERRLTALAKDCASRIEIDINEREETCAQLESKFTENPSLSDYEQYALLQKEVELLYDLYGRIGDLLSQN